MCYFSDEANQMEAGGFNLMMENKILIPILSRWNPNQNRHPIQQSFTLKAQSEQLLAIAKRAVELAIETNEQTALDFITEATNTGIQI